MKTLPILIFFTCLATVARCQQLSWDICIDGKKQISGSEGGKTDTLQFTAADTATRKNLDIRIREKLSNLSWTYTITVADTAGITLYEKQFGRKQDIYRIPITEILVFAPKHPIVRIYLDQHPSNPELSIRSKRTPLVIIQLKP